MMRRLIYWLAILLVMALCGWMLYPFFLPASALVARQQDLLLKKAAHHDWKKIATMVAADYHDPAGMNKEEALQTAKELLDPFLTIEFVWTNPIVVVDGKTATITGTLRMRGTGPSGGSMITDQLNKIQQPWTFTWRGLEGWRRGEWELISVSNPEAEHMNP